MRLGLRGTTRRVWGRRGTKVRQRLQLKYEWQYLCAAVEGQTGRVWWNWMPSMKAEALWPTIAGNQEMGIVDGIVWDNAPSHRDGKITDLDLAFVGLPPYSPELNPAERVFQEVCRRVEGRTHDAVANKQARANAYLRDLAADPHAVTLSALTEALGADAERVHLIVEFDTQRFEPVPRSAVEQLGHVDRLH